MMIAGRSLRRVSQAPPRANGRDGTLATNSTVEFVCCSFMLRPVRDFQGMLKMRKSAMAALLLTLAACTGEELPVVGSIPLTKSYGTGTITFTEPFWQVDYVYTITKYRGRVALCGSKALLRGVDPVIAARALTDLQLRINDRIIHQGFNHFGKVNTAEELTSRPATCRMTATPWDPSLINGTWNVRYTEENEVKRLQ